MRGWMGAILLLAGCLTPNGAVEDAHEEWARKLADAEKRIADLEEATGATGSVCDCSTELDAVESRLDTNEGAISSLETDVATIAGDYLTSADALALQGGIDANDAAITSNTTSISTNAYDIAQNTADLGELFDRPAIHSAYIDATGVTPAVIDESDDWLDDANIVTQATGFWEFPFTAGVMRGNVYCSVTRSGGSYGRTCAAGNPFPVTDQVQVRCFDANANAADDRFMLICVDSLP